jgi:hypothetical protein
LGVSGGYAWQHAIFVQEWQTVPPTILKMEMSVLASLLQPVKVMDKEDT